MKFFTAAIAACRKYCTARSAIGNAIEQGKARKGHRGKSGESGRSKTQNLRGPRTKWTDEQKKILSAAENGTSMFITGAAGTGKTSLVQQIIKRLKRSRSRSNVYVTASTGVAACALGGLTIHSFAGIGGRALNREDMLDMVVSDSRAKWRWKKVKALIIDEISMVDAILFEDLEYIARKVRERDDVWGGIQLVVSGDFFQLPPVASRKHPSGKEFAFEADCWYSSFQLQVELTKNFRQSDPWFLKLLQGVRRGCVELDDVKFLTTSCSGKEPDPSAVWVYPRNDDVNEVNATRMGELCGERVLYTALDSGKDPWIKQLNQGIAPAKILLCEGARVMLIKNWDLKKGLVNGATGTVTRFVQVRDCRYGGTYFTSLLPVVKFDSGLETEIPPQLWEVVEGDAVVASRYQIPLVLAWALSIHKCQGLTLEKLHTDLSRAFDFGMVYVVLSRVKSLDGLYMSGFSPSKIKVHPKVLEFYQRFAGEHGGSEDSPSALNNKDGNTPYASTGVTKCPFSLSDLLSAREIKIRVFPDIL